MAYLSNYHREHITHFAEFAIQLHSFIRGNIDNKWTTENKNNFHNGFL